MRIDEFLPTYEVSQVRLAMIAAPVEVVYAHARRFDMSGDRVVDALNALRMLPQAIVSRARGGEPAALEQDTSTMDELEDFGWVMLADEPPREFVVGMVGKVWRPTIAVRRVGASEFAGFDEPGFAKIALGFRLIPYGSERTLLVMESRTVTTDEGARRNFGRYWRLIEPFAGVLVGRGLGNVRRQAEAAARGTGAA